MYGGLPWWLSLQFALAFQVAIILVVLRVI